MAGIHSRHGDVHIETLAVGLGAAGRALVEHLLQAFGMLGIADAYPALFLPGKVVVLESFYNAGINVFYRCLFELFGREEQRHFCLGGRNPAVVQVPEGRGHVMPVADQAHDRDLEQFAQFPERLGQNGHCAAATVPLAIPGGRSESASIGIFVAEKRRMSG